MARETELIFRATDPSLPATQELAASLEDFEFASSRARINGAGASGAFILVLEALAQDGSIMVQSRIDQQFAVGDTVAASWAPFLRREAAATPASAVTAQYINRHNDNGVQSIASGTGWKALAFGSGTTVISDAARFAIAASTNDIDVKLRGLYVVRCNVTWDTPFSQLWALEITWNHVDFFQYASFQDPDPAAGPSWGGSITQAIKLPSGTSTVGVNVMQLSGAAQVVLDMYMTIDYLMDFAGLATNSDPD